MAPTYQPLQVEAIAGERMCFLVHSERNPRSGYRVDLLANGGRSECSCRDWATRRWPLIRNGAPITNGATRCKHVIACRTFVMNATLVDLAGKETQ